MSVCAEFPVLLDEDIDAAFARAIEFARRPRWRFYNSSRISLSFNGVEMSYHAAALAAFAGAAPVVDNPPSLPARSRVTVTLLQEPK